MTDTVKYTTELNALRARIDQLEAEARLNNQERAEQVTNRRGMLRLAGAAAVGGLAAVVAADPVAAGVDGDVVLNSSGNAGASATGIGMAAGTPAYGLGCYEAGLGAVHADLGRPAVFGHATGTAFTKGVAGHNTVVDGVGVLGLDTAGGFGGSGVHGQSSSGKGVLGTSASYIGVYGTGGGTGVAGYGATGVSGVGSPGVGVVGTGLGGALNLEPSVATSPPSRASHFTINTLETDGAGNVWYCYESGTPGKWRKIAGPATAGAFHAIVPVRVYDSRAAAPVPVGIMAANASRVISIKDGRDGVGAVTAADVVPAGATAVSFNITATGTTGPNYLSVVPGDAAGFTTSNLNWGVAGESIANGGIVKVDGSRQVKVFIGDQPGSTHVIIDVSGYYL